MSSPSCKKIEAALWCYVDRELSARELRAITRHLQDCARCRRLYDERAREARLWSCVFAGTRFGEGARGEGFVRDFRSRLEKHGLTNRYPRGSSRREWTSAPLWSPVYRRLAVVAAMLLLIPAIVVVGLIVRTDGVDPLGRCVVRSGRAEVSVRSFPVRADEALRSESPGGGGRQVLRGGEETSVVRGSVFEVAADSAVSVSVGGDQIDIEGPARFEVDPKATNANFKAALLRGRLLARVSSRLGASGEAGGSFIVFTPHATARVIGTRFRLEVGPDETRLSVEEGKVSFRPLRFVGQPEGGASVFTAMDPPQRIRSLFSTPEPVRPSPPEPRPSVEPGPPSAGAVPEPPRAEAGAPAVPAAATGSSPLDHPPVSEDVDKSGLDNPVNSSIDEDERR